MKMKIAAVGATTIAAIFLILSVRSASAGNPIPGVDVKLGRNPGGQMIAETKADKAGKFVFDNLEPGKYLLNINVLKTRSLINTTRSNIKHGSMVHNGVQVDNVSIEFGQGKETKPFAPVEIEIKTKQGKIIGEVTRDVATKESGVK